MKDEPLISFNEDTGVLLVNGIQFRPEVLLALSDSRFVGTWLRIVKNAYGIVTVYHPKQELNQVFDWLTRADRPPFPHERT